MNSPLTFYFYDLETSGFSSRGARIMQFAGQRTDANLVPIGEPHEWYIKLSSDIVPDPDAVFITGITPQKTLQDGVTEREFLQWLHQEVLRPNTTILGYNSIRFDDEFMRTLHYRNFYDPYEWQWQDGRGKWDLLDVVRMMRALRPAGIEWPVDSTGKASNRLELLTSVNKISHQNAHTAGSDVAATIAVAQLILAKQPKLFRYLLDMRQKSKLLELVKSSKPFVYTSGKYASEYEKTAVVLPVAEHPKRAGTYAVFDLHADPNEYLNASTETIEDWFTFGRKEQTPPIKLMAINRCPAVAPLGVLDAASEKRIKLTAQEAAGRANLLLKHPEFGKKVQAALAKVQDDWQAPLVITEQDVDGMLYSGFLPEEDRTKLSVVRAAEGSELSSLNLGFSDQRLSALLPLYKARNFPKNLTDDERQAWESYRKTKLLSGGKESQLARFFDRLGELAQRPDLTGEQQYLLEELQLYGQLIMPEVEQE